MFTGAKSFRGAKDKEMIRFGETSCKSSITFSSTMREQCASIELFSSENVSPDRKLKHIELNGITLESTSELAGQFYAVVFSPSHLSLIREGPAFRRKFLDTAISQILPRYEHYLHEYQRILLQRNTLLKDVMRFPQLIDTMDVWEEYLARAAAAVAFCRARYVSRIRPKTIEVYDGISSGKEKLDVFISVDWKTHRTAPERSCGSSFSENCRTPARQISSVDRPCAARTETIWKFWSTICQCVYTALRGSREAVCLR